MIAQKIRGRRAAAAAALAVMALGVTGCGAINEQATTIAYAASDGIVVDVADLKVRNLLLVTNSAAEEARLIGSVVNSTDAPQTLNITVGSNTASVVVPARTSVKLEDEASKTVLGSSVAEPGAQAEATLSAGGASADVMIPVVNGALAEYREYLPGGYNESTTQHIDPTEEAAEGH